VNADGERGKLRVEATSVAATAPGGAEEIWERGMNAICFGQIGQMGSQNSPLQRNGRRRHDAPTS